LQSVSRVGSDSTSIFARGSSTEAGRRILARATLLDV
jgi:hypothetical protein